MNSTLEQMISSKMSNGTRPRTRHSDPLPALVLALSATAAMSRS